MTEEMEMYYFGCWQRVGHYFYLPGKSGPRSAPIQEWKHWWAPTPWKNQVDGTLTPGKRDRHGRLAHLDRPPQGDAALHHLDGWTALALHDYTVDSRGASNSVFFFHATLDFDQTITAIRNHFVEVLARIGSITLVEQHSDQESGVV